MAEPRLRPQDASDEPLLHRLVTERLAPLGLAGHPDLVRMQHRAREGAWYDRFGGSGRLIITVPPEGPAPDEEPAEPASAVGRIWAADDGDSLRIVDLAVLSAFHRRGIGTHVLQRVRQQSDKPLILTVARDNGATQAFYARLGFVQTGQDKLNLLLSLT